MTTGPMGGQRRPGDAPEVARISRALLRWFGVSARQMDWRETRDPYRIWVSEIMLQQTRVETVAPYYRRFLARFPDIGSLAAAPLDDVLAKWEGLGYYARARNLHRAARAVVESLGGAIPGTVDALAKLPGIGRSTAGAISAIAFGRDAPVLDANARRVVSRLFAVGGEIRGAAAERILWDRSAALIAPGKGRETALALMDLGATICVPRMPRCRECPLRRHCAAFRAGLQGEIPPTRKRKTTPHYDVAAALIRRADGGLLVVRRPASGLLGGLWAFPSARRARGESNEEALGRSLREKLGVGIAIQRKVGAVRHAYSHYRITLHGYVCCVADGVLPSGEGVRWVRPGRARDVALPRADRSLVESFQEEESR